MLCLEDENVLVCFSDRSDGDLALYQQEEGSALKVWQDLEIVRKFALEKPVFAGQVHGKEILVIDHLPKSLCPGNADAVFTSLPDVPVGVFSADCLPVLFWHSQAVAAVHAGWRGSCQNICAATVAAFSEKMAVPAAQIKVAIGPCIGQCCLEMGEEVFWQFIEADPSYQQFFKRKKKWHLDLVSLNRFQLTSAGVKPENIAIHNRCTFCHEDEFYSFRRQKRRNGSMFSFVVRRGAN